MGEVERAWTTTDEYPRRAAVSLLLFEVARGRLLPWLLIPVLLMVLGAGLLLLDATVGGALVIVLGIVMLGTLVVVAPLVLTARIRRAVPGGTLLRAVWDDDSLTISDATSESRIPFGTLAQIVSFRRMVFLRMHDRSQWIPLPAELLDGDTIAVLRERLSRPGTSNPEPASAPGGSAGGRSVTIDRAWVRGAGLAQLRFALTRPPGPVALAAAAAAISAVVGVAVESVIVGLVVAIPCVMLVLAALAVGVVRSVRRQNPEGSVVAVDVAATELRVESRMISGRIDLATIDRVRRIPPCVFLRVRDRGWFYLPAAVLTDEDLARIAGRPG